MSCEKSNISESRITRGMANSKTDVQDAPDNVSKPLPSKTATLLEQIAQFTYIEARACSTLGFYVGYVTLNPYLLSSIQIACTD